MDFLQEMNSNLSLKDIEVPKS